MTRADPSTSGREDETPRSTRERTTTTTTGKNPTTRRPTPNANVVAGDDIDLVAVVPETTRDGIENVASGLVDTETTNTKTMMTKERRDEVENDDERGNGRDPRLATRTKPRPVVRDATKRTARKNSRTTVARETWTSTENEIENRNRRTVRNDRVRDLLARDAKRRPVVPDGTMTTRGEHEGTDRRRVRTDRAPRLSKETIRRLVDDETTTKRTRNGEKVPRRVGGRVPPPLATRVIHHRPIVVAREKRRATTKSTKTAWNTVAAERRDEGSDRAPRLVRATDRRLVVNGTDALDARSSRLMSNSIAEGTCTILIC